MVLRRKFMAQAATGALAMCVPRVLWAEAGSKMKLGMVTYMWGAEWDLPMLLANCEKTGILGVELRTTHKHGVERGLSAEGRRAVKQRFANSPVACVGIGSAEEFDSPDPDKLAAAIAATKEFIHLSADVGGSGVKVRPNNLHEKQGIPREKTLEQIGKAYGQVAAYGAEHGQELRMEAHSGCAPLPTMERILEIADHPNARLCWNSNPGVDVSGEGLEHNFNLVRPYFGHTLHANEFDNGKYPYDQLASLLVASGYDGWVLLEATTRPEDKLAALNHQRELWAGLLAAVRKGRPE